MIDTEKVSLITPDTRRIERLHSLYTLVYQYLQKTMMKKLVQMHYDNGLSILYDRVLEISAELGDAVVSKYIRD